MPCETALRPTATPSLFTLVAGRAISASAFSAAVPRAAVAERLFGTANVARVEVTVAREARVRLSVVDVLGRRVSQLLDAVHRPGRHQAAWDGMSKSGRAPAGLYLLRFEWPGQSSVRRLLLVP